MKTQLIAQPLKWSLSLSVIAIAVAGAAFMRSADLSLTRAATAAANEPLGHAAPKPAFEYARLVFTVGGSGTTVWVNTPANAVTAPLGKDGSGSLANVVAAIKATAPDAQFPDGVPVDDMMLVQCMGVTQWELVAVTQNQVDIGVTTSYYFRRRL